MHTNEFRKSQLSTKGTTDTKKTAAHSRPLFSVSFVPILFLFVKIRVHSWIKTLHTEAARNAFSAAAIVSSIASSV